MTAGLRLLFGQPDTQPNDCLSGEHGTGRESDVCAFQVFRTTYHISHD